MALTRSGHPGWSIRGVTYTENPDKSSRWPRRQAALVALWFLRRFQPNLAIAGKSVFNGKCRRLMHICAQATHDECETALQA